MILPALVFLMTTVHGCAGTPAEPGNSQERTDDQKEYTDKTGSRGQITDTNETGSTDPKTDTNETGSTDPKADTNETDSTGQTGRKDAASAEGQTKTDGSFTESESGTANLIRPEGMTLAQRFAVPDGFRRTKADKDSFCTFLRNYPLKEDQSPVLLYDQTPKGNQNSHAAVFKLPLEQEDLQQCADSIMRMYAEYFWHTGQYDRIAFHFVNGFYAQYQKWREGWRIQIQGNQVSWALTTGYDDSYENFQKYLRIVFSYASTISMEAESEPVGPDQIRAGDILIQSGSPGHVVMVADICKNERGEKAFLLAQGYMPAQEFHVLKNPMHEDDPWYYETEVVFPFLTPDYTFPRGSLRRLNYMESVS